MSETSYFTELGFELAASRLMTVTRRFACLDKTITLHSAAQMYIHIICSFLEMHLEHISSANVLRKRNKILAYN